MGLKTEAIIVKTNIIGEVKRESAEEIVKFVMKAVKRAEAPIIEKSPDKNKGFIWEKETFNFEGTIKGIIEKAKKVAIKSPQNTKVKEPISLRAKPAKRLERA